MVVCAKVKLAHWLRQDLLDHPAMHIGQAHIATAEPPGQSEVIDPQQVRLILVPGPQGDRHGPPASEERAAGDGLGVIDHGREVTGSWLVGELDDVLAHLVSPISGRLAAGR